MATNPCNGVYTFTASNSGTVDNFNYAASNTTHAHTTYYYPNQNSGSNTSPWTPVTEWQPVPEPIPLFADAKTARANLQTQLELLQSFMDELSEELALQLDDAIYFLQESIDHLDNIIGD